MICYTINKVYRIEVSRKVLRILCNICIMSNIKIYDNTVNRLVLDINLSIEETIRLLESMYLYMSFGGYNFTLGSNQYYDLGKSNVFKFDILINEGIDRITIYDNNPISNNYCKRIVLDFYNITDDVSDDYYADMYTLFMSIYESCLVDIISLEDIASDFAE